MRVFVFSLISCVLFSACSHKEQIAQYEQQLKESNEALEEVINYRRRLIQSRFLENPVKAKNWHALSEQYYEASQIAISHFYEPDFIDSLFQTLKTSEDWNKVGEKLKSLSKDDSIVAKNVVINQLNKALQMIDWNTTASNDGIIMPSIVPKIISNQDSTLVILTSNFPIRDNNFDVFIEHPAESKLKPLNSLGYLYFEPYHPSETIRGFVNFTNDFQLRSWQIKFSTDSIQEQTLKSIPYQQKNP